ncbi:unnamed protein product [[Actinomadura] parvosata subsp. kistnae]|uniref:Uncharacterized protein n=1 Tax=[Actinomadura] parvosata subsp. kistnae TaxID=1909395 RepID=A0A1V0AHY4_9ACTN|nr:hypothetical protein [Nonomuraea sp. ATCC 55076]AQZ69828.1 hypothetical protein BKM31_57705 [Nonomuraea sp. ATCC 55076]SPL90126.1 unnamed protein product [Actinomadura parvosata subsp. kistnae]
MDDLESRLGTLLGEPGRADPPPGLAGRIHRSVAVRRRKRRAAWLAALACQAAVLVAAPLMLRGGSGDFAATVAPSPTVTRTVTVSPGPPPADRPTPTRTITPSPGSGRNEAFAERLRRLVAVTGMVEVGGRTGAGEPFTPAALGSDGTVLGLTPGGAVAETSATGGAPEAAGFSARSGLGAAEGLRTWTENGEQRCRAADGSIRTISPQGTDPEAPVWVDGGAIAGNDPMLQPWVAVGCAEPGRTVTNGRPATGTAVAFSYPYLFVVEPADDRKLRLVDVRTMRVAAEHPLPAGVRAQTMGRRAQRWQAAATDTAFVWVTGKTLHSVPRDSWGPERTSGAVPAPGKGEQARMTAGDRLVAYTTGGASIVHDPVTGVTLKQPGLVLAAGPWLLWEEGGAYRLARVG